MDDRFTPEELEALIKAGDLTFDTTSMLPNNADQRTALMMLVKAGKMPLGSMPMPIPGLGGAGSAVRGAAGKVAGSVPEVAKRGWNAMGDSITGAVGMGLGNAVGHPWIGWMAGNAAGKGLRFKSGNRPPVPPGMEKTPRYNPKTAKKTSYGGGLSNEPADKLPPNLTAKRSIEDLMEQQGKGVQNNFKGPVHIEKGSRMEPANPAVDAMLDRAAGSKGGVPNKMNPGGHGTFKDPSGKAEFPPGTSNKTSPKEFINKSNDYHNSLEDPSELARIQRILAELLNAK